MEEKKDMLGHDIPQEPDDTYAEQKHHPLLRGKSITGGDRLSGLPSPPIVVLSTGRRRGCLHWLSATLPSNRRDHIPEVTHPWALMTPTALNAPTIPRPKMSDSEHIEE